MQDGQVVIQIRNRARKINGAGPVFLSPFRDKLFSRSPSSVPVACVSILQWASRAPKTLLCLHLHALGFIISSTVHSSFSRPVIFPRVRSETFPNDLLWPAPLTLTTTLPSCTMCLSTHKLKYEVCSEQSMYVTSFGLSRFSYPQYLLWTNLLTGFQMQGSFISITRLTECGIILDRQELDFMGFRGRPRLPQNPEVPIPSAHHVTVDQFSSSASTIARLERLRPAILPEFHHLNDH